VDVLQKIITEIAVLSIFAIVSDITWSDIISPYSFPSKCYAWKQSFLYNSLHQVEMQLEQ
jgi:hypothetical protein